MDNKIIMLVGDWYYSRIVYTALKKEFNISNIIIDNGESKWTFLRRRIRRLGLLHVIGQLLFRIVIVSYITLTSKNRSNKILQKSGLKDECFDKEKTIEITSINSPEGHALLKKLNPDIVIIVTTRILSRHTLQVTKAKFLNIHSGITPLYRGVHGGYWALINNDNENCGVTVHLVDEGIDTGGVLYQDTITDVINPKDNFLTYTYLQLSKAIPLLKKAIIDIQKNDIKTKKVLTTSGQSLFYQPTFWFYLYNRLFKGVK